MLPKYKWIFQKASVFLARFFLVFLITWGILIEILTWDYLDKLTSPRCPQRINYHPEYTSLVLNRPDGSKILAWFFPSQNGATIILAGGHGSSRDTMLPEANVLSRHGYGILTFDSPPCYGKKATFGYKETEDVILAVTYARHDPGTHWVGVLGFSAGGAAAIRAAARNADIEAVIAIGNYANLWSEISSIPASPFSLEWQLEHMIALQYWLLTGAFPDEVSPIGDLPLISPRPVLLIHGELEAGRTRGEEQFRSARPRKDYWVVPGANHGEYRDKAGDEYERRILHFLSEARQN